ncbi:MAG: rhodanese-like domain-containing protein [Polyangiales bacterium]
MRRISAREAHELMGQGYVYLDVRSAVEFALGRPRGAINVPLGGGDFVEDVRDLLGDDARMIVGCATGVRSVVAAQQLLAAGFTDVLEQRAGMDGVRDVFGRLKERGWRDEGLPIEE